MEKSGEFLVGVLESSSAGLLWQLAVSLVSILGRDRMAGF